MGRERGKPAHVRCGEVAAAPSGAASTVSRALKERPFDFEATPPERVRARPSVLGYRPGRGFRRMSPNTAQGSSGGRRPAIALSTLCRRTGGSGHPPEENEVYFRGRRGGGGGTLGYAWRRFGLALEDGLECRRNGWRRCIPPGNIAAFVFLRSPDIPDAWGGWAFDWFPLRQRGDRV